MNKRIFYCCCLSQFFLATSCCSQKQAANHDANNKNVEKSITLSGFPSRDTASIIFYKKDVWFLSVKMQNPEIVKEPESCKTCHAVFTDAFLDNLSSIKTETVSKDCRITKDTLIEGKQLVEINDFYLITDLQEESISFKKNGKGFSISYLEPRNALKYCKNNTTRLAFIRVSDRLLKIK